MIILVDPFLKEVEHGNQALFNQFSLCICVGSGVSRKTRTQPHLFAGLSDGGSDSGPSKDDRDDLGLHLCDGGNVRSGGGAEMCGGRHVHTHQRLCL